MKTIFTIQPRKAGIFLGILAVVMSVLAVTGDLLELTFDSDGAHSGGTALIWPFARQFNFVEEGNLANFYQGLQLVLAAVLLLIVWRGKVQSRERHRGHWLGLGLIFLFLGADEIAQIHETTIANTIAALRHSESGGMATEVAAAGLRHSEPDKTGWFWLYVPLLAAFGAAYLPFLMRLPRRIAVLFIVAGAIYVGGAIGVEKFVNWFAGKYGDDTVGYVLIDNLGEFMESTGIALFVYAILCQMAHEGREIAFRIAHASQEGRQAG